MDSSDLFHEGELAAQERAGLRARAEQSGRTNMRSFMSPELGAFFEELPFVVVGALDGDTRPWASLLTGPPGFMQSKSAFRLAIGTQAGEGDALQPLLVTGAPVGLLGIEPYTRRRVRLNGTVAWADGHLEVRVAQCFGNCPRHIQTRWVEWSAARQPRETQLLERLDSDALQLIANTDTFFVASAHPGAADPQAARAHGVDVSHRGGAPGFVKCIDDMTLVVPDFTGNAYLNTIGNLMCHPYAGLLFIDFERNSLLQLSARAEIVWEAAALRDYPDARRLIRFKVLGGRRILNAVALGWSTPDATVAAYRASP